LLLPLDVANTREDTNIDMRIFWYIVQMSSLFYVCVILPFGLYYAESDEEKEFKWRICSAFKNEIVTLAIISVILFPCYTYLSYANIPVYASTCSTDQVGQAAAFVNIETVVDIKDSVCKLTDPAYMNINVNFPIYATSVLTFMGWMMLCFFLPTGMWGIPFDWIG